MGSELFDWSLMLGRWLHIVVGICWIGSSFFFMWLDRSFHENRNSNREGHIGELWMVHGGGFYSVEKLLMGPTKVPPVLHWFKWEAYWTWLSGIFLLVMIFYTGSGTFLLDSSISKLSFAQGLLLALSSVFVSWLFYDFMWELKIVRKTPLIGHILTVLWFIAITVLLCKTLSGRAAYIHVGAMLGTWMAGNVLIRIIPRQVKMVEASKKGESVNREWSKNAKYRSTHNTYFTLPVIFIMLSNHFPATYGHELNWLILILLSAGGAAVREFFVVREFSTKRSYIFLTLGILLVMLSFFVTQYRLSAVSDAPEEVSESKEIVSSKNIVGAKINGVVNFSGEVPEKKELRVPSICLKRGQKKVYSNGIIVTKGKLKDVLIRIVKGHENLEVTPVPEKPVILDQDGCVYRPKVIAVRTHQPVKLVNSDPIFHNVRSTPKNNPKFDVHMPQQGQEEILRFDKPEIVLKTTCSVHPWMGAYIAVLDHPFFDVTNRWGEFNIGGLATGEYTIEAWHSVLGILSAQFKVSADDVRDGKELEVEFTFKKEDAND